MGRRAEFAMAAVLMILAMIIVPMGVSARTAADEHLRPDAVRNNRGVTDGLEVKMSSRTTDGGFAARAAIPLVDQYTRQDLQGRKVLMRVDFNVSDKTGKIKSDRRLREAMKTIRFLMENGATVVLISHNEKPKGKVVPLVSLKPVAQKLSDLFAAESAENNLPNIEVVYHDDSIRESGLNPGLYREIAAGMGKVHLLENTRFTKREENNDIELAREFASLVDNYMYIFDAFGTGERLHASSGTPALFVEKIGVGYLMQKEDYYLKDALKNLYGFVMGGGPKLFEKMPMLKRIIPNIKKDGFVEIGSAPSVSFLKVNHGIVTGQPVSQEDEDNVQAFKDIAQEYGVRLLTPIDFIVTDRDLSAVPEGSDKSWIDMKKAPEGTKSYTVTLQDLLNGSIQGEEGRAIPVKNLYIYDIGPQTIALYRSEALKTPQGKAIVYNGTMGVEELSLFAAGSKAMAQALKDATKEAGAVTVIAGGDTVKSAEKNKVDEDVSHCSTGGGASGAILMGKELKVVDFMQRVQAKKEALAGKGGMLVKDSFQVDARDIAEVFNMSEQDFRPVYDRILDDAMKSYYTFGGMSFEEFLTAIKELVKKGKIAGGKYYLAVSSDFAVNPVNLIALRALDEVLGKQVQIGIYGANHSKAKKLINGKNIVTALTLEDLKNQLNLNEQNYGNTMILFTPGERAVVSSVKDTGKIRQSESDVIPTLTIAKTVQQLIGNEAVDHIFESFFKNMFLIEAVVSQKAFQNNFREVVAKKVAVGELFDLTSELKTEARSVTQRIEGVVERYNENLTKIGV